MVKEGKEIKELKDLIKESREKIMAYTDLLRKNHMWRNHKTLHKGKWVEYEVELEAQREKTEREEKEKEELIKANKPYPKSAGYYSNKRVVSLEKMIERRDKEKEAFNEALAVNQLIDEKLEKMDDPKIS